METWEVLHTFVLDGNLSRTTDGRQLTKDEYSQLRKSVAGSFVTNEFFYCEVRSNKLIIGWLSGSIDREEMYEYINREIQRKQQPGGALVNSQLNSAKPIKDIQASGEKLTPQQQTQYLRCALHYAYRGLQHAEFATDTHRRRWWGGLRWRSLGRRDTQELNERLARDTEVLRLAMIGSM